MINLCKALLSIIVDEAGQYILAFTLEGQQYIWTEMAHSFSKGPSYFSQNLNADLDDTKFSGGSTILQYVDDLFLYSPSQASSQEDRFHHYSSIQYLGYLISEQG